MLRKATYLMSALLLGLGLLAFGCSDDDGGGEVTPICGNGECEEGETATGCPEDCGCGNDILNDGEECDGPDLAGQACQDFGYEGGALGCTATCTFDLARCTGGGE